MTFDEKEKDFTLANHIHIGEELYVDVNHIGNITFRTIGNSIEKPITMFKVQSTIKLLRLTPKELEELGEFLIEVSKKIDQ